MKDIGDYLGVPEAERLEADPPPEYNADSGFDVQVVPDGEVRELSTADPDEQAYSADEEFDDASDGTPLYFIDPADPEFDRYDKDED